MMKIKSKIIDNASPNTNITNLRTKAARINAIAHAIMVFHIDYLDKFTKIIKRSLSVMMLI